MVFNDQNQIVNEIQGARLEEFSIKEIDFDSGPYCMSFGFDLEKYKLSIEAVGVINSPTVVKTNDGKMTPVTGYRRLLALRALHRKSVFCRDLTTFRFSDFDLFVLNLEENLATRKFNDVEKGMILNGLTKFVSMDSIIDFYMPLLGLVPRRSEFIFYTKMENELSNQIKGLLVSGGISQQTARTIMSIDKNSRSTLAKLISDLKLNINKQRQLIEYLVDLSEIKSMDINDILCEKKTRALVDNRNLNGPQKARALLSLLKSLRFPLLDSSEKEFNKRIDGLNLPKAVKINHPPFFESPNYTMEILFRDGKDLMKQVEGLKDIKGLADLKDPWLD